MRSRRAEGRLVPRVLLQPRGTRRVRGQENFEKSIVRGLPIAALTPHLSLTDLEAVRALGETVRLWGSTPTDQAGNEKARALAERRPGDLVFFYAEKSFIARARIAHLLHSVDLARAVWGSDEDGRTWEHVLVLSDVKHQRRSSAPLLTPLGINPVIRGVTLLSTGDSERFLLGWDSGGTGPTAATAPPSGLEVAAPIDEALELMRDLVGLPLPTVDGRINRILALEGDNALIATGKSPDGELVPAADVQRGLNLLRRRGSVRVHPDDLKYRSAFVGAVLATVPGAEVTRQPARISLATTIPDSDAKNPYFAVLDGSAQVKVRKEQGLLRRLLLGDEAQGRCALCGSLYPAGLLVAAHIKRRAICSDAERNDLENVAMLACALGCDSLYEAGYLSVNERGFVVTSPTAAKSASATLASRLNELDGRPCGAHTADSAEYFDWHYSSVFRD